MGLEALLATLEGRAAVTPATSRAMLGVTRKPASALACTAVTCVTAANDLAASPPAVAHKQKTELRALIALILAKDSDADRAEALAIAVADPDAALVSFRMLAADMAPICTRPREAAGTER